MIKVNGIVLFLAQGIRERKEGEKISLEKKGGR